MINIEFHKNLKSAIGDMLLEIDLTFDQGAFVTLFGKSGAGKTSMLRIIAGLLVPDGGRIEVNGVVWVDDQKGISIPARKRNVGLVFQDYALFPHMTIRENLHFALKKGQDTNIVDELIEIMELGSLQSRKPISLSGGQQQRVALARAIVQKPTILLLDEPLSALDYEMRAKLQNYLLEVHRTYNLTTILVSHDLSEIIKLSDLVVMIEEGRITNQGHPKEVFAQKKASGKFQFIGEVLSIEPHDFLYVVTILIGNEMVKVVVDEREAQSLKPGDTVWVATKAFNPIIRKLY